MPKIIIIGAGIQGISVALALAKRGVDSTIIESHANPMRGASYGNEGKIHLGLVYALDHSGDTGLEMLKGAHSFSPLLDSWCGKLPWHKWTSKGFRYAMMPSSLAEPSALKKYYEKLRLSLPHAIDNLPVRPSYFGKEVDWMWKEATDSLGSPSINGHHIPCIDTEEIAIDVRLFSAKLTSIIQQHPDISLRCHTRVINVDPFENGYKLHIESSGEKSTINADVVINCTWENRIKIDQLASVEIKDTPLSYRIKHRVVVKPREMINNLKPVTMVQGPFGDVVPYKDGSIYLSWYPECRTYFEQLPPPHELSDTKSLNAIASRTLEQMSAMYSDLVGAKIISCSPGIIVAEGTRDVDDPKSELHRRATSGVHGGNGWWSVDTGKLTLAPLHGDTTARLVLEELGIGIAPATAAI